MTQRGQRLEYRCPRCRDSQKPGHLWLRGSDYLMCPDCDGTTRFVMYEQRLTPPTRIVLAALRS